MEKCAWCYEPIENDPYKVQGQAFHQECKEYLAVHPDCWPALKCDGFIITDGLLQETPHGPP